MIKITNEIDGKLYELVPEVYICEGCDLKNICQERYSETVGFNGCSICAKLHGVWKEVKDEKQYEYGVESFFDGHWIIEQTGLDELCEAEDYIDVHKQNHPEDKLRTVRREIGKWKAVKNEKAN